LSNVKMPFVSGWSMRTQRGFSWSSLPVFLIGKAISSGLSSSPDANGPLGLRRICRSRSPRILDDPLADVFVRDVEIGQEIVIEKMAERPMPHVMEEPGHAHIFLDERRRWAF